MMKIEVNVTKKYFFSILAAVLILIAVVGVTAYNNQFNRAANQAAAFGHSADEVVFNSSADGNLKTVQEFLSGIPSCESEQALTRTADGWSCINSASLSRLNSPTVIRRTSSVDWGTFAEISNLVKTQIGQDYYPCTADDVSRYVADKGFNSPQGRTISSSTNDDEEPGCAYWDSSIQGFKPCGSGNSAILACSYSVQPTCSNVVKVVVGGSNDNQRQDCPTGTFALTCTATMSDASGMVIGKDYCSVNCQGDHCNSGNLTVRCCSAA